MVKKLLLLLTTLFLCCASPKKGSFQFTANGEEFARQGLTSREGWALTFDHLYVNIKSPRAFLPGDKKLELSLPGEHWLDLVAPAPVTVGIVDNALPGNYRALEFGLKRRSEEPYKGYSIVLAGKAEKEGKIVSFEILLSEELTFTGLEGYVGETIKGIIAPGGKAEGEMTFHFDHFFGNQEVLETDHVNSQAPGFTPFLEFEKDGHIRVTQKDLEGHSSRQKLITAIHNLGHLGEGHCQVSGATTRLPGEV